MNRAARQRLQAAVNRLVLRKIQIAKSARGACSFCQCDIRAGDGYRAAGPLRSHAVCLTALATDLAKGSSQ
jgi:hypothetical protein